MVRIQVFSSFITQLQINRPMCTTAIPKPAKKQLIISCKRKSFDHYSTTVYNKLDSIPLASKGWTHSKAKGDFFVVNPVENSFEELQFSFQELNVDNRFMDTLKSEGITKATDFQRRAIETVGTGSHVMLAAETGCGKTLSYLLPIIQKVAENKSSGMNAPRAIVVVPNRELAYQIGEMAETLGQCLDVKVKIIVGGRTKQLMMFPHFEEVDLLVATPGVLSKLSTVGVYKLGEVAHTILDEADTLMDDSFLEKLTTLINRVPQSQIILVTATLPRKLPDILKPFEPTLKYVISPKIHKPLLNIHQKFLRLTHSAKPGYLLQIAKANKSPMLIFSNKNETCNWVSLFLSENGVDCANINGDMNYALRIDQWNKFASGKANILSATDVGSRGLNTIQVRQVLNYDFPLFAADYIHRIGRVGRFGSPDACRVTNFLTRHTEIQLLQQIELAIRRNEPIENVDGNITKIVQTKIAKKMQRVQ
ncbi:unnamed protein product [Acanthoscelides obtectus]|uniref:RNA helicase n=1 Tax=Acanthoscelides obtectus TaxID=200917 RepID=A0A9P0LTK1_ACAOB|nr:unnamed protein product [Acanthoscelides obtectus]CAK1644043.1 Probable ATP-dependent RNA helicase DDX28 [Acanthoscelides obtectus]